LDCYWRKESGVKLWKLLCGGRFLRRWLAPRRADRNAANDGPANHEENRRRARIASVGVGLAGIDLLIWVRLRKSFGRNTGASRSGIRDRKLLRIALASCTEATTPSTPTFLASCASFTTRSLGAPLIPTSFMVLLIHCSSGWSPPKGRRPVSSHRHTQR